MKDRRMIFLSRDRYGLDAETQNPFDGGLLRRVEPARRTGLRQPLVQHGANHLSTFGRQRRILLSVHSVLCESLRFGERGRLRPRQPKRRSASIARWYIAAYPVRP